MSARLQAALLGILFVLTTLVYWEGLDGPFLFDDFANIPRVQIHSLDLTEIKDAALSNTSGRLRRPVANLSFALNGYFLGQSALAYKGVNLFIHLFCGWLVFLLVRGIVKLAVPQGHGPKAEIAALVAAGFWLLHPIQVSTVLYTVQRMAQLSTLFAFLAVLGWLRWRAGIESGHWRRSAGWVVLIGVCSLLSLFSKESGALIPLLLLVVELCLFGFRTSRESRLRWAVMNGLMIALPLSLGLIYTVSHWDAFSGAYVARPFTMPERLMTEIHAIWHYMRLIFIPNLGAMGLYYDDFPITRSLDATTFVMCLGIVGLLSTAIWNIRRRPILSIGILWFFAGHALESTFIALEPAFEHRNYLPLLGPALIVGYYTPILIHRTGDLRKIAVGTLAAFSLALAGMTFARVDIWSTHRNFIQAQVLHHPTSFRVNLDLINGAMQAREWSAALATIASVHRQHPDNPTWPLLRLFVACGEGKLPDHWITAARDTIGEKRVSNDVVLSLQALTGRKIQHICPAIPNADLLSLVKQALDNPLVQKDKKLHALLLLQQARLYVLMGDMSMAASSYTASWKTRPSQLTPLLDLANLQIALKQYGEAEETISVLEQVVADKPLQIGETQVASIKDRLRRERLSSPPEAQATQGTEDHD